MASAHRIVQQEMNKDSVGLSHVPQASRQALCERFAHDQEFRDFLCENLVKTEQFYLLCEQIMMSATPVQTTIISSRFPAEITSSMTNEAVFSTHDTKELANQQFPFAFGALGATAKTQAAVLSKVQQPTKDKARHCYDERHQGFSTIIIAHSNTVKCHQKNMIPMRLFLLCIHL